MRAYSEDLRERIVAAVQDRTPKAAVARTYRVGLTTVDRYIRQQRETGSLAGRPIPGRPAKLGRDHDPALTEQVRAHPDATLREHCAFWAERTSVRVSPATMSRALARALLTRKRDAAR